MSPPKRHDYPSAQPFLTKYIDVLSLKELQSWWINLWVSLISAPDYGNDTHQWCVSLNTCVCHYLNQGHCHACRPIINEISYTYFGREWHLCDKGLCRFEYSAAVTTRSSSGHQRALELHRRRASSAVSNLRCVLSIKERASQSRLLQAVSNSVNYSCVVNIVQWPQLWLQ